MQCYETMDNCMNSGKDQNICYQNMNTCIIGLQNEMQECFETIEDTAIKNW